MSKTLPVESGHPIPKGDKRGWKYPFHKMNVEDSFPVPVHIVDRVQACAYAYGKRHKQKFTVRRCDAAYRCWRTE